MQGEVFEHVITVLYGDSGGDRTKAGTVMKQLPPAVRFQLFLAKTCLQHLHTTATILPLSLNFGSNLDLTCLLQN